MADPIVPAKPEPPHAVTPIVPSVSEPAKPEAKLGLTVAVKGDHKFIVTTTHWSTIPKGTIRTESELGGPENVLRLLGEGCIAPHTD